MEYLIFDTQNCKRREKKEKSHECHNTKEQILTMKYNTYIYRKTNKSKLIKKKESVLFSSFFVCVPSGTFFLKNKMSLRKKFIEPEKLAYRSSSIFQRSSVSFFGSSGIDSSRCRF